MGRVERGRGIKLFSNCFSPTALPRIIFCPLATHPRLCRKTFGSHIFHKIVSAAKLSKLLRYNEQLRFACILQIVDKFKNILILTLRSRFRSKWKMHLPMQIQMHMSRNLHLEERMEFLEHPAQSSTEQYRCSMRVIYCSETMCLAGEADFQWPGDRVGASWCHICHLWL